jgi:nickel-dependent lactate racemase
MPWGDGEIRVPIPDAWHMMGCLAPSPREGVSDVAGEVARALGEVIGSPRLRDLARVGMHVALIVDDDSRPTPVAQLLPGVLADLDSAGVESQAITVVTALGLHRPMEDGEIAARLGGDHGIAWENHNCDASDGLVRLGTTSRGTPVWVNRTVAEADLVVSIGCIEPHLIASFGGGYKNIVPGVAGRETVAHNHSLNCAPHTFNMVGQPISRNPMRLDLEEGARMLRPPVFVVNAVLNSAFDVVRVVAGDPVAAHRCGRQVSGEMYGVHVPQLADVVFTDSHPMDQDLRQGVKALANAIRAVRRNGVLITLIRAREGVGVFGLANRRLPLGRGALRALAPLLLRLVPRIKLSGMGEEDRFFLYFALQALRHCTMLVYAPTIPSEVRASLPFVRFVDSVDEAVDLAQRRFPGPANALAFPHGGTTYPILPSRRPT